MCIADGGEFSTRVLLLYIAKTTVEVWRKKREAEEARIRHWFNRVVFLLCLLLLICNGKEIGIWVKFICFMPFKSGEKQNETESNAATLVWISFGAVFLLFAHPAANLYSWMHHCQFSWIGHEAVHWFIAYFGHHIAAKCYIFCCDNRLRTSEYTEASSVECDNEKNAVNLMMEIVLSFCAHFSATAFFLCVRFDPATVCVCKTLEINFSY